MKIVWYCSEDLWASTETTECKECGADMTNIGWFEYAENCEELAQTNLEEVQNEAIQ